MSADHDTNALAPLDSEDAMQKIGQISMQLVDRLRTMYPDGRLGMVAVAVEVHYDAEVQRPDLPEGVIVPGTQIELVAFSSDPRNWVTKAFFEGIIAGFQGVPG